MKITKIFITLILAVITDSSVAQTGIKTEERNVTAFHDIGITGFFDVYILQAASENVKVEATPNVSKQIFTDIKGETLNIYTKDNFKWGNTPDSEKRIAVYVYLKDVNNIVLTGSGNAYFKEGLKTQTLHLIIGGSGKLIGEVTAESLISNLNGSGQIEISGHAENSKVDIVGSANFNGRNLITSNTNVRVGGSGVAEIYVSGKLEANLGGSGFIRYTGKPVDIIKSKTGSGDIMNF